MRIASVVVEILLLQVPQRADHSNIRFGARRHRHRPPPAGRAAAAGTGVGHPTDQQIGSAVIAQFSCKILPFFPRALRCAAPQLGHEPR
jgi:hypothetical protein